MVQAQASVAEALAGLVHQFADPMACFRELVQNAVDAGSTEIDIRFEHVDGRLVVHVDDYGEGMDRHIIDTKLTRLFSSSKEGDRTKIGRFGIGFVSVFALQPEVICIDTSRAGEHWRVIFLPDRSFRRVAREQPVDGTKITIYKTMAEKEARAFIARAREVIAFWCRHVPAEIRIEGRSISRAFGLELACVVTAEIGDARIVVGYDQGDDSSISYYNRGLTLLEERPGPFPGVHVKLWSPELEHTMTRDNVLRDEGHARVLGLARAQVEGPLREQLIRELAARAGELAARTGALHRRGDEADGLMRQLLRHLREDDALPKAAWRTPLVRCHHAGLVDLNTLRKAAKAGRVTWASQVSPLTEALHARGELVIAAEGEVPAGAAEREPPRVCELAQVLAGRASPRANAVLCTSLAAEEPASWGVLRGELDLLLSELGPRPRPVAASLEYANSAVASRVAIAQEEVGAVSSVDSLTLTSGRRLIVNVQHPTVLAALRLAAQEPELAAYKLAKTIVLEGGAGLSLQDDHKLAAKAMERRWRRMT
ncbi:ATP-binding protein [Nannocystis sp.]|uniref:sacsin N-terminal ATP-binding-like domain-containing protein n=1 Tax=Nannocystis sp. TaxID=1962667 RepID=UPI0025E24764|nr:ATP-binding protein [Nannocystis sp.]